jgi:RimJ/RimL family protein N-acetyltransferase/anti-sigma regulatory factor (Ser/Thr protein kinase)
MDQQLELRNHASVIGPATDFAYRWGLNVGLSDTKARRLALAVDELVTDVVCFAYPGEKDSFQITFRTDLSTAEVIIQEQGVPFSPSAAVYERAQAVEEGDFDRAGYAVVEHCVDEVQFLNKGAEGKEFRLAQHIEAKHIVDLAPAEVVQDTSVPGDDVSYRLEAAEPGDAMDIAKLIYRTYGHTYSKEELYYPDKIERALRNDEKFGVLVRTEHGAAVGNFAVLRDDDSAIGEVGEAVVDVNHRRQGLMTRMLEALVEAAEDEGLIGVYGTAVTAHEISQRANARFDFVSSALNLAYQPRERFTGLLDDYPQPISNLIDFKPLVPYDTVRPHLPAPYADLLTDIYEELGATVAPPEDAPDTPRPDASAIDARIEYEFQHAVLVVEDVGRDVVAQVEQTIEDLDGVELNALYVDLPLESPHTPPATAELRDAGFVLAGLAPRFHREEDHLRLQHPFAELDPDAIVVYSDLAHALKEQIMSELQ